jgi:hypothetical protein
MRSNDEKRTGKKRSPLTGREGDELEPIIDPIESYLLDELSLEPGSPTDAVDEYLSDDHGRKAAACRS